MIRAVVFDLGGVLTVDPHAHMREAEVALGLPRDALVSRHTDGDPAFDRFARGEVPRSEFLADLAARLAPLTRQTIGLDDLDAAVRAPMRADMIALLTELIGRVRLGVLTNNAGEHTWRHLLPPGILDVVVDSSDAGVAKPDPRIYRILLERLALDGPEVVFVDDAPANLPPAAALGIRTIRFERVDDCRRRLAEFGVLTA